jgi:uncharacterized Zn-binding protein involved in type VI secretion
MTAAARQWDPIEHSNAMGGLLAGLAIGATAALIGLAIVGTGGLAAVAIIGASAVAGAGIGELVGSLSFAVQSAGNIVSGSPNVHVNGLPAARAHVDKAKCDKHGSSPQILAQGSSTVHINGMPAARVGDSTVCDGKISSGSSNVFIGGGTDTTDDISPEVPGWLHRAMFVVGVGAAVVLAGPVVAIAATVAGYVGGSIGFRLGGRLFGEGSDGQKLSAFGGALLGGALGAKGGRWFDARYEVQAKGLGSNLGNIKVSKKPLLEETQNEKVSPETYGKLRKRTPSSAIRKIVNKDVNLPMKDPALPGMDVTKSLHADHIQPMKTITEMDGFAKLSFKDQVAVLNYEPNFVGLSEVANTSKGAQSFSEWTGYKKGNIEVDPAFKTGMIERSEALKPEIQQLIYDKLSKY